LNVPRYGRGGFAFASTSIADNVGYDQVTAPSLDATSEYGIERGPSSLTSLRRYTWTEAVAKSYFG
jgi:hypothetical protein